VPEDNSVSWANTTSSSNPHDCSSNPQHGCDPPKPGYETKTMHFVEQPLSNNQDQKELEDIILKMHNLMVCDPKYVVLYPHMCHQFPNAAKPLPLPKYGPMTIPTYQAKHCIKHRQTPSHLSTAYNQVPS